MIYADQRWIGDHGIGRFARHVLAPAAPLDAWRLARALDGLTHNDLFFSPGYNTPLYCASPFVFTICDLSHIYCPENTSAMIRLYYATIAKRAARRAQRILTISEFTRRQIVEWSGVPAEKIFNVSCGVDSAYHPGENVYGLPFPYLLCVSNRKRHKNELRVVEAFAKTGIVAEIKLVFTGDPTAELADSIARKRVTERVHFAGRVAESKLPSLYRGAEALVFPSLYEGFGLPLLEAMACGTPVVTSNTTALPEVAGDAALLVDPTSIDQIAEAINRIVRDTTLREQLRKKGLARASQFRWSRTTEMVHELIGAVSAVRC
jgi:glycosyltransferase involved in cell wall biosynthesis